MRTYFLIIAVENYKNPPLTRVKWAQRDAEELINAWKALGHPPENFTFLINDDATKTGIEYNLKKIAGRATKGDRVIIFFAGHGFSVHGVNLIAPVDAHYDAPNETCVSIDLILGHLKKSESENNLLFLDCCHSGFEAGENIRAVNDEFQIDDLEYLLKDEVYCVGFASCRSHQKSIAHPALQHGVWTHFLIEALSGNAKDLYENKALVSDKLQSYLRNNTAEFVKNNTDDKKDQTPVVFGSFSDRFVVEDLSPIFHAREIARKADAINMTSIIIFDTDEGRVSHLPDFKPGQYLPDKHGSTQENFIRNASGNLASNEIDEISEKIKNHMGYGIDDFKVAKSNGFASVATPDFSYSVEIFQSPTDSRFYIVKRSLDGIYNPDIITDPGFNKFFQNHFRQLSFQFDRKVDVRGFISKVEKKAKEQGIQLEYSPTNPQKVRVKFPNSLYEVIIDGYTINITIPLAQSPAKLIEVYKETKLHLQTAEMDLLMN